MAEGKRKTVSEWLLGTWVESYRKNERLETCTAFGNMETNILTWLQKLDWSGLESERNSREQMSQFFQKFGFSELCLLIIFQLLLIIFYCCHCVI